MIDGIKYWDFFGKKVNIHIPDEEVNVYSHEVQIHFHIPRRHSARPGHVINKLVFEVHTKAIRYM